MIRKIHLTRPLFEGGLPRIDPRWRGAVLRVSDHKPLAKGSERAVYPHPFRTDKVIKVVLRAQMMRPNLGLRRILLSLAPATHGRGMRKEWVEYQRLRDHPQGDLPIASVDGWVETDLGRGLVTEKVSDADGRLAPSLKTLNAKAELGEAERQLVNDLVSAMYAYGIRAGDITAANIVLGYRPGSDTRQAVLIDGLGDIHAVPVRSMSRWTNALGLDDSFRRAARRLPWHWDGKARQFKPTAG